MKIKSKKAFTLIELLVVVAILSILIVVITTFNANDPIKGSALQRITYTDIRNEIHKSLNNSINGYGGISVGEGIKDEKTLLPEEYMVFFQSSLENDDVSGYFYNIQLQNRENAGIKYTRVINKKKNEYKTPGIFLKSIRLKIDESDTGISVNSFGVSFKNPTGKESFYLNNNSFIEEGIIINSDNSAYTINEFISPIKNTTYNIAELNFYGNDGKKKFIQKIYKDKRFPVSLIY